MKVIYFPYEKKINDVFQIINKKAFEFFYEYEHKVKNDEVFLNKIPYIMHANLTTRDIYIFNHLRNEDRYCVLLENDEGFYLGHVFIWFKNNVLYMQGIQSCLINLIYKNSKDSRYISNIHKYLIEAIINIAKERNCNKIIVVDVLVHMQKLLFKYGFYPRCYCNESLNSTDNRKCEFECRENRINWNFVRCCHYIINKEEFLNKAEYLEDYTPKRINNEDFK